jgi:hypothetical protein
MISFIGPTTVQVFVRFIFRDGQVFVFINVEVDFAFKMIRNVLDLASSLECPKSGEKTNTILCMLLPGAFRDLVMLFAVSRIVAVEFRGYVV